MIRFTDYKELSVEQKERAAHVLSESLPRGWPTQQDAAQELAQRDVPENILLVALEHGEVVGLGGMLPHYDGRVFELHPIAVRADKRKRGIGRAILRELESRAKERGGLSVVLGADDDGETGETSLADKDLFQDLPDLMRDFDPGTHQTAFYKKLGYSLIGVAPNANGPGRPDIWMGKSLI